jgi:two-component system, chemotaxis family, sensor kinase CheA
MAADPYRYFRIEARELLEQMGQGALDLEKPAPSPDLVSRMLRLAHTLKGAARVVRQPQIAESAHQLEELFTAVRDSPDRPAREQIDRVLALLDAMSARLAALTPAAAPATAPASGPAPETHEPPAPEPLEGFRPDAADMQAVVEGVAQAQTQLGVLRPRVEQADRIRHLIELVEDQLAAIRSRDTIHAGDRPALAKALSMVDELRGRFGALDRSVAYGIEQIDRELRLVADAAARLQLVPVSSVFRFLERAARDAAQALGTRIAFETSGGAVRVDADVLGIVRGALLQMVRNAVAHGIEPPDARRAAGKSDEGRVGIAVVRRGASIAFSCMDDGRGVDAAAVRRAIERRSGTSAAAAIPDDAVIPMLLRGGLSTSASVTEVSGRGIGLDVARAAAERLGGALTMTSEPGRGTTIELMMPSSVASFSALLVEVGSVTAALPLDAVRHTMRVGADDIVPSPRGNSILHGGVCIPLRALMAGSANGGRAANGGAAYSAVVIESDGRSAAFAVDHVLGTASIVVRPLPDLAPAIPAVVGASLDAVGHPRIVLDPDALVADAALIPTAAATGTTAVERPRILVIDDSLTTRMLEQSILESAGYDVTLASSAEEGLEKARLGEFRLCLVDVEMPGMDGFTFIEQVRLDPALRQMPCILVTSRASAEDRQRGRDVGADGYVVKGDFDQRALLDRIRSLVG